MEALKLKRKEEARLRGGHSWVFSNEIAVKPSEAAAGAVVEVVTASGASLGLAFYNPHSLIAARLLHLDAGQPVDSSFFEARLGQAAEIRHHLLAEHSCYRLVHGESDFLPGLIVDRYGDCLVVQCLSAGMDSRLAEICHALERLLAPAAILERNDSFNRKHEGLPMRSGILQGKVPAVLEVSENGIRYHLDLLRGQKTGFFLDQKTNRSAVARYCHGKSVLDCFCNIGGFALNAARAGATHTTGVDASQEAVDQAMQNAALNQISSSTFVKADVFEFLTAKAATQERVDILILDPPSFTRNRKQVPAALKAYRRLNELACRIVASRGFLITASCSFHIQEEVFYRMIGEAAQRAGRQLQLLERRHQSPDHPVLPGMPETSYLKLGIFRVL